MSVISRNAVVYYHDSCVDGFGAAWAFHRLKESAYENVDYIPVQYGKAPPISFIVSNREADLYILDFSFSRTVLTDLAIAFNWVTVLDHHKTAQEDLQGWEILTGKPPNIDIVFDMNRSGAGITWDYFGGPKETRTLIDYIEDRDLWRFALRDSKEIQALIGVTNKTFEAYSELDWDLANLDWHVLVAQGELLLQSNDQHVQSIIKATKRPISILGHRGLVCNCPGQFKSEVGQKLLEESGTYGATYFHKSDGGVKFSLRSNDSCTDVSALAKHFGGGGHRNAAGFTLSGPNPETEEGITLWNMNEE